MSAIQRFFKRILPAKWAANMETESKRWVFTCENCDTQSSFWDIGGIRWKATGDKRTVIRCPACGDVRIRQLRYLDEPAST
ncbi:MAG: hypothetical protein IPM16_14260 [Chloroflexi bacterium]|nr:hypothetical protein [Chloroflexota bacterium]